MNTDLDTTDHGTGTPTRTSTVLSLLAGLLVIGLVVSKVDRLLLPVIVGSVGALSLAASLWLVSRDRWEATARIVAGLLTVPVSLGLLGATAGAALVAAGALFPVSSTASLSIASLQLVTQVGIVGGCVFAILGISLGIRNVVDRESLGAHYWLSVQTGLVPTLVGGVLVVGAFLTRSGGNRLGTTVVDPFLRWLLAPSQLQTHLATLLFLVTLLVVALRAAIGALPIAELLADSGTGVTEERRVAQLRSVLGWTALVTGLATLLALGLEVALEPGEFQQLVGPGLYELLRGLSTAPAVRTVVLLGLVVSAGTYGAVYVLRRVAKNSANAVLYRTGPFLAGGVITLTGITFARPLVNSTIRTVGTQLPGPFSTVFFRYAYEVVGFFGASALVVVATTMLITMTVLLTLLVRFAVFAGYLSDEMAGYSLASGGLLIAASFAGTLVTDPWIVFVTLVGSLFVWDMGRYGTTLGHEVGRNAPTRNAELVHAGGTITVGLLGVGAAYGLQRLLAVGSVQNSPTTVVALMGVLAGIVFLVTALR